MRISVVIDSVDPDALVDFWCAALGYQHLEQEVPGFRVLVPADAEPPGPVLLLQEVPERRGTGKNRLHIDCHPHDVRAHVARLEALGGTTVNGPVTHLLGRIGVWWQVMTDPEGNELCLVGDPGTSPP